MNIQSALKNRVAFRAGIVYTMATWLLIQGTATAFPRIGLPVSAVTLVIASEKGSGTFNAQALNVPDPFSGKVRL